jgi:cytoskeletal protein CcmA (bactofilin family)
MARNCSCVRENNSCTAVLFAMNVAVRGECKGGASHSEMVELFGIHSQK